jgi:multicomponent Na+:H+ antiporter subunit E
MIALFLIWLFFNSRLAWDVVGVGIAICVLVGVLLKNALDYSFKKELKFIFRLPHLLRYIAVLIKEVIAANWAMVKVILNPWSRLEGQLYFFTPDMKSEYARVLLGNSITLTPGTITVQLKNGRYCIHTIKDEFVDGIEKSALTKEVQRLEEKFNG